MWWFPQLQLMTCQVAGSLLHEEGLVHERQGFLLVQLNITIIQGLSSARVATQINQSRGLFICAMGHG